VLLEVARRPIVPPTVVNAGLRVERPYMITPKGVRAGRPPPRARLYGPPLLLAQPALGAVAVFYAAGGHSPTRGYVALVLFDLAMVVALLVTALALELCDLCPTTYRLGTLVLRAGPVPAVAAVTGATAAATVACWTPIAESLRRQSRGAQALCSRVRCCSPWPGCWPCS
jgi:hypothetical protein